MDNVGLTRDRAGSALHRHASAPVVAVAGLVSVALMVLAPRYGWHRDELYFREAGRHLAWGFVDQPPFTPFVARVSEIIAPDNLVVLRLLPAVATGASVVMGSLMVREFGGDRRAQVLGAGATAAGGFLLGVGHLLSTATFDLLVWLAVLWLLARTLRTADPRWWMAIGAVAGASMLNKNLVVLLGLAIVVGLVVERRWDLLFSPWLAAGAGIGLTLAAPNLWWQAGNGWPQSDMARALSERLATENRITLVPLQILFVGPVLLGAALRGTRWLRGAANGRRFLPLLWAWFAGIAITFAVGGRPYYVVPLSLALVLAGIAATPPARNRRLWTLVAINGLFSVVVGLPVLPVSAVGVTGSVNEAVAETVGWVPLVDQVADVVDGLPANEQPTVVLLGATYGEAGALDRFGPARGLPSAYSPHNGYADFRRPTDEGATVVAIRFSLGYLQEFFDQCEQVAVVENELDIDNEVQGAPIVVCRGIKSDWAATWNALRYLA
ncbi:MAG: glycosyltransferase family 39 protein [Acidimicrobiales bacterium]